MNRNIIVWIAMCCLLTISVADIALAQPKSNEAIAEMVTRFKDDPRGPYKDLRWFCNDGTFRIPQERCPGPSPQRARYKDEVTALATSNKIYLGQILSTTVHDDFWDVKNANSRAKQYQVEKYLRSIDDGWILRKGKNYRGAIQAEDEENWGFHFLSGRLENNENVRKNFFLLRELARDLPHQGDDNLAQSIRSISMVLSDQYPAFMNARIKIHSYPDASDIGTVRLFMAQHKGKLNEEMSKSFDDLIKEMEIYYQPVQVSSFNKYLRRLPKEALIKKSIEEYLSGSFKGSQIFPRIKGSSEQLYQIRTGFNSLKSGSSRLALMDISLLIEKILLRDLQEWKPLTIEDLIQISYNLGFALTGAGYVEEWEWAAIRSELKPLQSEGITINQINKYLDRSRRLVEWGTGTVRAIYQPTVALFTGFEPLSVGFIDDRIRSSLLLSMGNNVGKQGEFFSYTAGLANQVMNVQDQGHIRGLNPGYAMGELVVSDDSDEVEVNPDKIYLFDRPPADLKPLAGIATVTEGNAVSHVQLLARNLGIPNAIISRQNLESLKKFSGQKVFYAVSNAGTVIMKPEAKMSATEKALFATITRSDERIKVPVEEIRLDVNQVVNLSEVRSNDSGKLCGPKAANLGQLKAMFPDHVVEGLVIPFGVFLDHMKQQIPGKEMSYWNYLESIFSQVRAKAKKGESKESIESFVLSELQILREAIKGIELKSSFLLDLDKKFSSILGSPIGRIPVFLRSDTNMEDLKDFSGAGLNLTVFNAVNREKILQGIRDVWASPYTERSYKWRQNYLLNPENVYPSILIIPSVDVDYSGVMITKGIVSNKNDDLTIAFSRGAGGAVDGQAAESYLLTSDGANVLLSPAREPSYNSLPMTGGTLKNQASFNSAILNDANLMAVREFSTTIKEILPRTPGVGSSGPFDVELGFKNDKLWLFQVRPFVENKRALSSEYLQSISPKVDGEQTIFMNSKLPEMK